MWCTALEWPGSSESSACAWFVFFCGCVVILKLGLHGDRKSTVYERSALAELLAGVAPRLSDYHGLPNLRTPISSSIILPLFLPPELQ